MRASSPPAKVPSFSQSATSTPTSENLTPAVQSQVSPPSADAQPPSVPSNEATKPEESPSGEATAPGNVPPAALAEDTKPQAKAPATAYRGSSQQKQVRPGRAVGGNGVVIVDQNGTDVKYRKKCTTCGREDSCVNSMPIKQGTTALEFFCPKCRKVRRLEIHGYV